MTTNIVYSTGIGPAIRSAYNKYRNVQKAYAKGSKEVNAAYHVFATVCEKEKKVPLAVYKELLNEE